MSELYMYQNTQLFSVQTEHAVPHGVKFATSSSADCRKTGTGCCYRTVLQHTRKCSDTKRTGNGAFRDATLSSPEGSSFSKRKKKFKENVQKLFSFTLTTIVLSPLPPGFDETH